MCLFVFTILSKENEKNKRNLDGENSSERNMDFRQYLCFCFLFFLVCFPPSWQNPLCDMLSCLFCSSGRDEVLCFCLRISEDFTCFILQDGFWFMPVPFFSVRSNLNLLHNSLWITFPTLSCLVLCSFVLFSALTYLINCLVSFTT